MGKTGGGRGTNQYAVRGVSRANRQNPPVLDRLAASANDPQQAEPLAGCVTAATAARLAHALESVASVIASIAPGRFTKETVAGFHDAALVAERAVAAHHG